MAKLPLPKQSIDDLVQSVYEIARTGDLKEALKLEAILRKIGKERATPEQWSQVEGIIKGEKVPRDLYPDRLEAFKGNTMGGPPGETPYELLGQQVVPYSNLGMQFGLAERYINPGYEPRNIAMPEPWMPAGQRYSVGKNPANFPGPKGTTVLSVSPELKGEVLPIGGKGEAVMHEVGKNWRKATPQQLSNATIKMIDDPVAYRFIKSQMWKGIGAKINQMQAKHIIMNPEASLDAVRGRIVRGGREYQKSGDQFRGIPASEFEYLRKASSEYADSYINILKRKMQGLPPEKSSSKHLTDEQFVAIFKEKHPEYFSFIENQVEAAVNKSLARTLGWKGIDVLDIVNPGTTGDRAQDIINRVIMGTGNKLARFTDKTGRMHGPVWKLGLAALLGKGGEEALSEKNQN